VLVHGLSNHVAWRCPTRKLLELYRANLSANHLEAGVGTGYFLDRAGRSDFERLVLLDINRNCLARAERRLARFKPELARPICLRRSTSTWRHSRRSDSPTCCTACLAG
jgi:ubiquinone/menaquinone biosynthesis C-methylase UbiE